MATRLAPGDELTAFRSASPNVLLLLWACTRQRLPSADLCIASHLELPRRRMPPSPPFKTVPISMDNLTTRSRPNEERPLCLVVPAPGCNGATCHVLHDNLSADTAGHDVNGPSLTAERGPPLRLLGCVTMSLESLASRTQASRRSLPRPRSRPARGLT